MSDQKVTKVVIAGGGTAGWITAAALSKQLGPLLSITLVESDQIGTVGVGEATIPTHRTFHRLIGVDEQEFMKATQATFKLGIAFENWARIGDRYIHSFGQIGRSTWMADFHHVWRRAQAEDLATDLGDYCFELQAAEAGKFATSEKSPINYAYHLDATLYAQFLRKKSEEAGVRRVEGRIDRVEQRSTDGHVEALVLQSGERIEGDLFIDCTGFRALLIEGTLQTGFEDWSEWLPTNSAFAVQTEAVEPARPYTRAMAHDAGWQWRIPLQHRVGNGLVYCSEYLSDDEAQTRLLGNVEGRTLTDPRLIRYQTGRRKKIWNKNVVSMGLSSGFLEPLESTSIHLIQIAATRLIQLFPFSGITPAIAARYNDQSANDLRQIRDFLILHYKLTERDDSPFWRRCRDMSIPDTLQERIDLFREHGHAYQAPDDLFRVDSWVQVMLGQRARVEGYHRMGHMMSTAQAKSALETMRSNIASTVAKLPTHAEFIARYCAAGKPG
ncbi:tryptophan halogenase family protein [Parvularcula sp. LCG005]|uniref:tryptophan halogenase family protein n=1 Tax=Parvularcula sp. LCG005 TaxID=3078805 RepID=UPI0029427314|nr:tryptophan halogenase family protein [Parvularcula sp. LCG005]WOI52667.1 tryptophan halogenase family protein [Parvularcula sp. LCG005]